MSDVTKATGDIQRALGIIEEETARAGLAAALIEGGDLSRDHDDTLGEAVTRISLAAAELRRAHGALQAAPVMWERRKA